MINKTLTKKLTYCSGKCRGLYNTMKYANPHEMSKLYPKYENYSKKCSEIRQKIMSDGKHHLFTKDDGFYYIIDIEGNIVWNETE